MSLPLLPRGFCAFGASYSYIRYFLATPMPHSMLKPCRHSFHADSHAEYFTPLRAFSSPFRRHGQASFSRRLSPRQLSGAASLFLLRHFLMMPLFSLAVFLALSEFSQRCMPPRVSLMPLFIMLSPFIFIDYSLIFDIDISF
jgi:hypothetical protein